MLTHNELREAMTMRVARPKMDSTVLPFGLESSRRNCPGMVIEGRGGDLAAGAVQGVERLA